MKTIGIVSLVALLATASTTAGSSLLLKAKRIKTDKKTSTHWKTSWGSYHKTTKRSILVEVTVRNLSGEDTKATVESLFLAKGRVRSGKRTRWIYSARWNDIDLPARGSKRLVQNSGVLKYRREKYAALGQSYSEGAEFDGWIVRLMQDDNVLKVVASSKALERLGKDSSAMESKIESWKKRR